MKRRALLRLGAGAAGLVLAGHGSVVMAADERKGVAWFLLADLEPDGLAKTYRRYRLVIVGQRDDERASAFAGAVVDVLARFLPTSRAQLARAADIRRVGVLIGTNQQDVAIMATESAEALFLAKPPFDDLRNVPLRLIVSFGSYTLVCRSDLIARHAFLLAQTLATHNDALPAPARAPQGVVPAHPGSHAFFAGETMPNPASAEDPSTIPARRSYS
jgi:hypothetical protein